MIPHIDYTHSKEGVCVNGTLPRSPRADALYRRLKSTAKPFPAIPEAGDAAVDLTGLFTAGEMPVLTYNDHFVTWMRRRQKIHDLNVENGHCTLPWVVLNNLSGGRKTGDVLYQSQRTIPDCSSAGTTHMLHSSILMNIGLGYPLVYDPYNFLYPFGRLKKGRLNSGAAVSDIGHQYNKYGAYPIRLVGNNVVSYDSSLAEQHSDEALKYQMGLLFLEFGTKDLVDKIFEVCHADLAVGFANSTAVTGATTDTNGVKVAQVRTRWAHMTAFSCHRIVKGIEYVGWINSHGGIYGQSDEGEPADMCWMTRAMVGEMCSTSYLYGAPFVGIPEATWISDYTIKPVEHFAFPSAWRV